MNAKSNLDTENWVTLGTDGRNSIKVCDTTVDMRRPQAQVRSANLTALPQNVIFDVNRTALIVVDMVNDFADPEGWIASMQIDLAATRALINPINKVAAALRAQGAPVIWVNWGVRPDRMNLSPSTQHPFNPNGRGPGLAGDQIGEARTHKLLTKDSWGAQTIVELEQGPKDILVDKHRISGFWDTPLNAILNNLGITTILFAGVNADQCVLGTLMDANFHGFDTIMLEDCVATSSPDFCMQATLHNVRFCFGFTATSDDLIGSLV
jgi:ureidoacrylate peracid hydrolase